MNATRLSLVLSSRPWRFVILAFVVTLVFPEARILTLSLIILFSFVAAIRSSRKNFLLLASMIALCVAGLSLHILSIIETNNVRAYMAEHDPPDPGSANDGTYEGTGEGPRGPTGVYVKVYEGTIRDIKVSGYLDAVSIDREAIDFIKDVILAQNSLALNPDLIDRSPATRGFYDAVCNALWKADPGFPASSRFTRLTYFFTSHNFSRSTFNAIAIIFIVFLLFDYSIQSIVRKDTGQSLVCYNCQTCVGTCPVKTVENVPYPMTMVLETRLGNYSRVAALAHYCVGCGRCAGKCPAGISAPRLASAAVSLMAQERK
jgi:ferredoxin/uncharacterized protein with FMN-binding domain